MPPITMESNRQSPATRLECRIMGDDTSTADPDHELMLSVRDGDIDLLGELFERHNRPLYGFFVRSTGNRPASEDLVQTVFMRILKYRHTYRDEGNFKTWMYHLARKCLADHYRKHSNQPLSLDEPEGAPVIADAAPDAAAHAEQADNLGLLRRALASLPSDQRELLVLHRFQHLSHEELAGLHNCSLSAMKVRVHRALNSLKDQFHRLYQKPANS